MTKFVCKIPGHQWQTINHTLFKQNVVNYYQSHLTIKNNLRVEKGYIISKTSTTLPTPEKNAWGTCRDKHTKKIESNNYAGTLPWKMFIASHGYWKWPDNFFHVTAGIVKFAVSQWPISHPLNFSYETRLYGGNTILEILHSRLKKISRDNIILVDQKVSDFVLSWTFVQKLLLAGLMLIISHL